MTLDNTDKKILELLQENARMPIKQIGEKVHKASTAVYERVRKMEEQGVIKKNVALLDPKKIGRGLIAFTAVELKQHSHTMIKTFEKNILKFGEIMECFHMTGSDDYLLKVMVRDMDEYQEFVVNKLSKMSNIGKVKSAFVMTEVKHDTAFRLI